ncbi:MAG: ABC transporter ATP-binding protein [Peptococcaceae bacterium]|nr:ABC transporter ATP-binding protein [Peptococcaceae bacterium]
MIQLKNVCYSYPGQENLRYDISTSFEEKKVTAILGPNGCGKSTLLKVICRLLQPSSGSVLLRGQDVHRMKNKDHAKQVALLSQTNHPPEITVEDLVAYGRYPHQKYGQGLSKEDKEIINQALSYVKADEFRHRMVNRLSGGQRQRAYIAMALAQDTDIIFLDEPTTYLDINIRFEIMELIRSLNEAGKTIIMVLHDLNLALEYSDHIILMDDGRIQTEGTPQQVIQSGEIDRVFNIRTHLFTEGDQTFYHFSKTTV